MGDELLDALGRHQREAESSEPMDLERPYEPQEREQLLDDVFSRLDAQAQEPPQAEGTGDEPPKQAEATPKVVELAPRRNTGAIIGAVAALAAALLVFWWVQSSTPEPSEQIAAIPTYEVTRLDGAVKHVRSDDGPIPDEIELRKGVEIDWQFTPAQKVSGDLGVGYVAQNADGAVRFGRVQDAEITPAGAVRLRGPLSRFMELGPGVWTLKVLIGHADHLPTTADAAQGPADGWQVIELRVTIDAD